MKRILALTLSLAMLAGLMTVSAVAAESSPTYNEASSHVTYDATGAGEEHANDKNTDNGGMIAGTDTAPRYTADETIATGSVGVKGWTNTDAGSVTHVYAVSITTTELTFSYGSSGTSYIWDPSSLTYIQHGASSSEWNEDEQKIIVTNYSDLSVDVTAEYTPETAFSAVTGTITDTDGEPDDGTISLAAATGTISNYVGTGKKVDGSFTLSLSGTPAAMGSSAGDATTIGTVTLTFKVPAGG